MPGRAAASTATPQGGKRAAHGGTAPRCRRPSPALREHPHIRRESVTETNTLPPQFTNRTPQPTKRVPACPLQGQQRQKANPICYLHSPCVSGCLLCSSRGALTSPRAVNAHVPFRPATASATASAHALPPRPPGPPEGRGSACRICYKSTWTCAYRDCLKPRGSSTETGVRGTSAGGSDDAHPQLTRG